MAVISCLCIMLEGCGAMRKTDSVKQDNQVVIPTTAQFQPTPMIVQRTHSNEKQVLNRLARNLEELNALVNEAEHSAVADSRIRFDYQQLRNDLFAITHGIRTHIRLPDYSPRSVAPIPGDYGR